MVVILLLRLAGHRSGSSLAAQITRDIEAVSPEAIASKAPLLLMGPTGAGKSQLARRVYELKIVQPPAFNTHNTASAPSARTLVQVELCITQTMAWRGARDQCQNARFMGLYWSPALVEAAETRAQLDRAVDEGYYRL